MDTFDVAVIGGGPAGMAAALSAFDAGAKRVLLVEREDKLGGILNQCTHLGFGLSYFTEELTGQEYASRFIGRILASEIEVLTGTAVVGIGPDGSLTLSGMSCGFVRIFARAIVMSTGCRERPIGALPVYGTRPAGIYSAGAAQKMLNLGGYNLGSRFIILGSGDVGMIVARTLAQSGKEVVAVVEKEIKCGGLPRNRINCLEQYGIPLLTRTTVSEVFGESQISGVMLTSLHDGDERFVACDALITSVGLIPERELLDGFSAAPLPYWLFLCGNACYVHDTVDDVTIEAERVGRLVAGFAAGGSFDENVDPGSSHFERRNDDSDSSSVICVACPKGCAVINTAAGWQGLSCGRSEPVLAEKLTKDSAYVKLDFVP